MANTFSKIKHWLQGLSFKSGVIVGVSCLLFYGISFAQMALPISVGAKTVLWVIFFGLAKTAQYTAILILGKEGVARIKQIIKSRKSH